MNFEDRFGAAFPNKVRQIVPPLPPPDVPGVSLATPSVPLPIARPLAADAQGPVINPDDPVRLTGTGTWGKMGPPPMGNGAGLPAPMPAAAPYAAPGAFPAGGVAPVPNVAVPTGPAGITLNSAPTAPGWAGTVGLPSTPEGTKGFEMGQKYSDTLKGVEEIAKGLKPKSTASDLNTITPMSSAPLGGAGTGAAQQLMAELVKQKRGQYGLSLTG